MKKEFTKMKKMHLVAFMVAFVLFGSGNALGQGAFNSTWVLQSSISSATTGVGASSVVANDVQFSSTLFMPVSNPYFGTTGSAGDGLRSSPEEGSPATDGTWATTGSAPVTGRYEEFVLTPVNSSINSTDATTISFYFGNRGTTSIKASAYYYVGTDNTGFTTSTGTILGSAGLSCGSSSSAWATQYSYTKNISVPNGSKLYVRFYPWITSAGTTKYFCTKNVVISGSTTAACTPPTVCTVNGTTYINSGSNTNITLVSSQSGVQYGLYIGTVLQSGTTQAGDGSSNLVWNVSPTSTTTYTVKTISDGTYCPTVMGSAVITVNQPVPAIVLTSAAGTDAQTPTVNNAITPITYSLASGTATTAAVTWTGTSDVNTPPTGISVSITNKIITISGAPSVTGTYGYTATTTNGGTPAATASGSMNVSIYTVGDYGSVATGIWGTYASTWKRWDGNGWNTTATGAPTSSNTVWIVGGYTVTVAAQAACNNLHVISGNLLNGNPCNGTNTPLGTIVISGTTVEVETGGIIGNGLTDDSADAISLQFNNAGTTTITGTGGTIDVSKFILFTANATVVVDHDMNVHYHGTSFAGNAFGLYANAAAQTLTINAGKTLTMAKWSSLGNTGTSHSYPATNFTVNVNGTLTLQAGKPTGNSQPWGWAGSGTSGNAYLVCNAGTSNLFTLAIGSTGTVNVPEFYPNGTVSAGTAGTGSVSSITIASGGSLNIGVLADFRNATQSITGSGAFNLSSGAIMRIGNVAGITTSGATGPVQTTTRSFDSGANYQYEGTAAQVTGNGLPATVNNLLINNAAGASLSAGTTVNGTLTLTNGAFNLNGQPFTLGNGANIVLTAGTLSAAPTFGTSVNLTYNGTSGQTTSFEVPTATNVLNNMTISNSAGVSLSAATATNGTLLVNTGSTLSIGNVLTSYGTITINGTLQLNNVVSNNGTATINGTLQLNNGGIIYGAPTYGSSSTLIFNTGGTYGAGNEWMNSPTNVTVQNSTALYFNGSRTINGTLTVNTGSSLSTGATLTTNGPVNINGSFQLNTGGWATGSGTWTYTNGTLVFNNSSSYGVSITDVFWPTTNGPTNVNILQGGLTLNSGANKTVTGLFQTSAGVTLTGATLTLNGTAQINSAGYFSNAPILGSSSTLIYNTSNVYGRSTEWNNPANVQISNNTTLNYPNGSTSAQSISGNLTIDAGSSLEMDYNSPSLNNPFTVGGSVTLNGTLKLGDAIGGDLNVGGNWTRAASGSTFNPNSRAVTFNGAGAQTISNTGGETFAYLTIANSPGKVVTINSNVSVSNDLTINAASALTLGTGNSLGVTGNFTINSTSSGTGTFIDNGTVTTSNATVNQYLSSARNWYISSPLTNAAAPSGYTYFKYDEPGNNSNLAPTGSTAYWESVSSGATLSPITGYIAQVTSGTPTIALTGTTLNTGSLTPVTLSSQGAVFNGYNLVGNPYPSYLDWTKVSAANAGITTSFWYRTQTSGNTYTFDTYNASGSTHTNLGATTVSNLIPPMQGFWVKANSDGVSFAVTNAMRSHIDVSTNSFKAPAQENSSQQEIHLTVSNGTNMDEAVLYFNPNASNGYDAYDSPKMSNNNAAIPEIYTMVGNEKLVINGMNSFTPDTEIPVGFSTGQSNAFSIKASEISNFDSGTKIYLKDNLLNTEQDLTDGTPYTFTSDVASSTSRFSVVFKSVAITTGVQAASNDLSVLIYKNANNQIAVNCTGSISENGYVSVYNALGQKLELTKITGSTTVISRTFASGVYVVTVNNGGKSTTKKVILN